MHWWEAESYKETFTLFLRFSNLDIYALRLSSPLLYLSLYYKSFIVIGFFICENFFLPPQIKTIIFFPNQSSFWQSLDKIQVHESVVHLTYLPWELWLFVGCIDRQYSILWQTVSSAYWANFELGLHEPIRRTLYMLVSQMMIYYASDE